MITAYTNFLKEIGIENITHQMTDAHAEYFNGRFKDQDIEIKVIQDRPEKDIYIRWDDEGAEDWNWIETYDIIDDDEDDDDDIELDDDDDLE